MPDAFTPRVCNTGENTGDTLGGIQQVQTGSLITGGLNVPTAPPPFGESAKMPITPPTVANLSDATEGTFACPFFLGSCGDSDVEDPLADTNEWDRDDQPVYDAGIGCPPEFDGDPNPPENHDGVVFTMITRVIYQAAGDEILYGYCREVTIDSGGAIAHIGPEVRVIIDTPVDCDTV